MVIDSRRPKYTVYIEALYYKEWHPRSRLYDTGGKMNEAAEIYYPFGRI